MRLVCFPPPQLSSNGFFQCEPILPGRWYDQDGMKFKRPNSLQSWLFSSAALLLFLMALLWAVMEILTSHEQARTPGERNLGVAVMWMTFQIPIGSSSLLAWAV